MNKHTGIGVGVRVCVGVYVCVYVSLYVFVGVVVVSYLVSHSHSSPFHLRVLLILRRLPPLLLLSLGLLL